MGAVDATETRLLALKEKIEYAQYSPIPIDFSQVEKTPLNAALFQCMDGRQAVIDKYFDNQCTVDKSILLEMFGEYNERIKQLLAL